ncbi:MAG TPA: hypothetical protein VLY20_12735 [Nitrospiria bacterium]|nr:hypothetical protein [Nitrospiria bacterium]
MQKRMIFIVSALLILLGSLAQAQEKKPDEPTTGELAAGAGFETLHYKNVNITPGGFFEAATLFRSANENADVGSTYRDIPLQKTADAAMHEFRMTARQSRVSLLAETENSGTKVSGYLETDFLGAAPTANETESNSWNLRLRQAWSNFDFPSGFSVTMGQAWSLLTTNRSGLKPRSEFLPMTIDAQYVVGYNWARQMQVRLTEKFSDAVMGAVSLENPETNIAGVVLPANVQGFNSSANAASPNSLTNATLSTDGYPDAVGKMVFEPGWGHYEVKVLGRAFKDRLNEENHVAFGNGVGAAALLPLLSNVTLVAEGLSGAGIGRYGAAVGPDVMAKADGTLKPIRANQLLAGLEWHPTTAWDVYAYYGLEHYQRTTDGATKIGYGSDLNDLTVCLKEVGPTTGGVCQANQTIYQVQPGFWYRFFKSKEGTAAWGLSYSYTHRELWTGASDLQPKAGEHIGMTSFRYYLP